MLRKKYIAFIILAIFISSIMITGCGGNSEAESGSEDQEGQAIQVGSMFSVPDPPNAGGWDRAHWAGLMTLKNEFGWDVSVAENVPYPKTAETAVGYLDKGYDMIIFPDNGMIEAWKELAPQYPDKWMIITSMADELPDSPKAVAYAPDFYEYGNLIGMALATSSETGKIGLLGGSPIPVLETLFSGAIEGAKYINPDAEVVVYWAGDWVDTAKHRELTALMTQNGVDSIFTVTGQAAMGVYEAAESNGAKVIGYCADLYEDNPNAIMTSLLMDTPLLYSEVAENFTNGTLENKIYNMGSKYFKFADFRGSVPEEVEREILDLTERFKNGEIEIPVVIHEEIMK
ncbi:MAG: BMP family ABC transporter substrate-binding protein [Thermoanaerobacterales bacterium]|jgi:basic membrane protein A|nr:BMP family ABC transporter substrate-binding protein [Thermoanaerobacterales bacterium]